MKEIIHSKVWLTANQSMNKSYCGELPYTTKYEEVTCCISLSKQMQHLMEMKTQQIELGYTKHRLNELKLNDFKKELGEILD